MSSNIVLPTLTAWAENHIKAVVEANQDDVESALDAFLSKDATLTINGAKVTRQEFAQKVSASKFQVKSTTVDFTNTVEAVAEGKSTFEVSSFLSLLFPEGSPYLNCNYRLAQWACFILGSSPNRSGF